MHFPFVEEIAVKISRFTHFLFLSKAIYIFCLKLLKIHEWQSQCHLLRRNRYMLSRLFIYVTLYICDYFLYICTLSHVFIFNIFSRVFITLVASAFSA